MRQQIWNFFSNIVYLFDFRVDVLHPHTKTKRWIARMITVFFSPVIIALFFAFNIVDSIIDFFKKVADE